MVINDSRTIEVREKGKGENSRVFTDDLNGGPGWTWTTDLALIRGFMVLYA